MGSEPPPQPPATHSAPPDAFGRVAETYELGRAEWPEELVDRVLGELDLPRGADVVDVGAGTGKLTRVLVTRFERVVAVEPDDEMRAVLERVVPEATALAAWADGLPFGDSSRDAVFCGEAFHWFATRAVVSELERVLRPGGALVLFWNVPLGEVEPPWPAEAEALLDDAFRRGGRPGLPRVLAGEWRAAFEGSAFGELREDSQERAVVRERDAFLAGVLSVSSIAAQPHEDQEALAARLRELVPPGTYRSVMRADAYWTRLVG